MKRFKSFIPVIALVSLLLLFAGQGFAMNAGEDLSTYESKTANRIISLYWQSLDIYYSIESKAGNCCEELCAKYKEALIGIAALQKELSSDLIDKMNSKNYGSLKNFSAVYKSRQHYERQPLYPVCAAVIEKVKIEMMNNRAEIADALGVLSAEQFASEYFPGYGYSEPGYNYRKGRELSSEFLSAYWQEEIKVIETAQHFEGTIEFKLGAELKNSPNVANYKELSEPFKLNVGGHIFLAINVSFDTRVQITTSARKKYAATKIWFELFRRKNFGGEWELCGKTFEMRDFYTNEEIITEVKLNK